MSDEKIELKLKDWLFNAGLLGFINILGEEARNNGELEIDDKNRLIRFSPKVLENFEYKYFDFFIKRYGKTLTYGKILEFEKYIDEFEENGEKIESINELKMINDKITFFKAKIKSESYKKAYDFIEKNGTDKILGLEKELKKIKELENEGCYLELTIQYDHPNQEMSFYDKKVDGRFRLRSSINIETDEEKSKISWKRRLPDNKNEDINVEEEIEVELKEGQLENLQILLEKIIRMKRIESYQRYRNVFVNSDVEIVVDKYPIWNCFRN